MPKLLQYLWKKVAAGLSFLTKGGDIYAKIYNQTSDVTIYKFCYGFDDL